MNRTLPIAATLLLASLFQTDVRGEELIRKKKDSVRTLQFNAELSNLFLWRNDSDFDSTAPYYDGEGQTVGAVTTFFKPQLTFNISPDVSLFYEAELGYNIWGKNDPDEWFPADSSYPVFKHREFWSRFDLGGVAIKTGYQRLRDPSDLFISHWGGAALMSLEQGWGSIEFIAAQLPDSTFEGLPIDSNNFLHDNFTAGVQARLDLHESVRAVAGEWFMYDSRVKSRPLTLFTGYLGAELVGRNLKGHIIGLIQTGKWSNSGVAEVDQSIVAFAGSARLTYDSRSFLLSAGGFALSPDDAYAGNDQFGAFFYSGKNSSPSLMLSEDEIRDRYDNFDERISATWGSFYVNRAGLAVGDLSFRLTLLDRFQPEAVVAAGFALKPENSGGDSFVGFESDLILRFHFAEFGHAVALGQLFVPGGAGAAFVNSTDREATRPIVGFQVGTVLQF